MHALAGAAVEIHAITATVATMLRRGSGVYDDSGRADWHIISEIASLLGRPDSTVRHWQRRYRDVIPSRRNARDQITYPLAVFERIRQMAAEGLIPREIEAKLSGEHQPAEAAAPAPSVADVYALVHANNQLLQESNQLVRESNALLAELLGALRELLARRP